MVQKALIIQIALLAVQIALGALLLNEYSDNLKTVHAVVGVLIAVGAAVSTYCVLRSKASYAVKGMVAGALVFVGLAIVGGKMAGTNYDDGLTLMRVSAVSALVLSLASYYKVKKILK